MGYKEPKAQRDCLNRERRNRSSRSGYRSLKPRVRSTPARNVVVRRRAWEEGEYIGGRGKNEKRKTGEGNRKG